MSFGFDAKIILLNPYEGSEKRVKK